MSAGIVEHSILQYVLQYGFAILQYIAIRFLPYCCTPTGFDTRSGNILSFLLPLFQEGQLSVTGESMCTKY